MTRLSIVFRSILRLSLLVAALSFGQSAAAAPCASNCLAAGDHIVPIVYKGGLRSYLVHIPASYTGQSDVPLLIDFHGGATNAWNERQYSGHMRESDRRGFIVVWPEGLGTVWNAYGCCFLANMFSVDDVGFARAVIAEMKSRTAVDADRVFATGISNGGGMAQRMACEAADVVRAAVSVSFPLNTDQCHPSRPISVAEIAGTADANIPYYGTTGPVVPLIGDLIGFGQVQGARESLAAWKRINGCTDKLYREQLPQDSRLEEYRDCSKGVRASLVTIAGGRHILYNGYVSWLTGYTGNNAPIDTAEYMWDHFFDI